MKFSVLLSVSGIPDHYPYHELAYRDVKSACEKAGLDIGETEPGDSEYGYLAREHYDCDFREGVEWDCDCTEDCDCQEKATQAYREACERERGINSDDPNDWEPPFWWQWGWEAQDLTASGILDRKAFDQLIDDLGAFAEDVQTLGTLGGPACPWGLAPDISFQVESDCLCCCLRVTPLPDRVRESAVLGEDRWERVRSAMISVYGS